MKRTIIAAAVLAAVSGSAFAGGIKNPYIFNATLVGEQIGVQGWVALFGCVNVSSTAGAVINNNQSVWVNASLSPNPSNYTSGKITTYTNNNSSSINGSGSAYATVTKNHYSASAEAQGYQKSSSYAYAHQSSAITGGGYEYSKQSSALEGGFSHSDHSQGAHLSAGGHVQGSYGYVSYNGPHAGFGAASAQGSLSAGYHESDYANSSSIGGSFSKAQGSGQGAVWGFHADQGSGSKAYAEQSSGYRVHASTSTDSVAAAWGINATLDTTNVTTKGKVTQHFNTEDPGVLTATTGNGAGTGISGNVGINVAQGVDNAQSNDAALASLDAGNVFGNAQIFNTQSSGGSAKIKNFNVNASIGDNSLQSASGNVGVNVASGIGNVQNNSLAASTTTVSRHHASSAAMVATDQNDQQAKLSFYGQFEGTASLGAGALNGASGNIGVNIAGGAGNLQHNGLAIAAMSVSGK